MEILNTEPLIVKIEDQILHTYPGTRCDLCPETFKPNVAQYNCRIYLSKTPEGDPNEQTVSVAAVCDGCHDIVNRLYSAIERAVKVEWRTLVADLPSSEIPYFTDENNKFISVDFDDAVTNSELGSVSMDEVKIGE